MRKFKTKVAAVFLAGVMATATLTGCGSSSEEAEGKVVTICKQAAITDMDPQVTGMTNNMEMISATVEGLYKMSANGTAVPGMAASSEVSEDGLTWTFTIRDDAKWTNGDPVTAYDFEYGFKRSCNPELDNGDNNNDLMITLGVVNASEIYNGEKDYTELGVEATDEHTFVIHLTHSVPYFTDFLTYSRFSPMNQKFCEEKGAEFAQGSENCIANGPYYIDEWELEANTWALKKNPNYYDAANIKVDTIEFQVIEDTQQAALAFENKDVDFTCISGEQVELWAGKEEFHQTEYGVISFIFPNMANEYLGNDNIRKALSYSIDRETLCDTVLKDGSIPANYMAAKGLSFNEAGVDFRDYTGTEYQKYDPEKALEYWNEGLKELGVDAIELTYTTSDAETASAIAVFLQNRWETNLPGLTINIRSVPSKQRYEELFSGDYELTSVGWESNYPDPLNHLELFKIGGACNLNGYDSTEYTDIITRATSGDLLDDFDERWNELSRAEKILLEDDCAIYPTYQNGVSYLLNTKVTGLAHHIWGAEFTYADLDVAE